MKSYKFTPIVRARQLKIFSLAGAFIFIALLTVLAMRMQPTQQLDGSKYQVVYLTNGQAYFGKLQNLGGEFLVMRSPYTAQSVTTDTKPDAKTDATPQTTLLKVTDQVYGPEDSIAIKASQVAFWQNLRSDSKVSTAIDAKKK